MKRCWAISAAGFLAGRWRTWIFWKITCWQRISVDTGSGRKHGCAVARWSLRRNWGISIPCGKNSLPRFPPYGKRSAKKTGSAIRCGKNQRLCMALPSSLTWKVSLRSMRNLLQRKGKLPLPRSMPRFIRLSWICWTRWWSFWGRSG